MVLQILAAEVVVLEITLRLMDQQEMGDLEQLLLDILEVH
jgi:hypothetical protein